MVSEKISITLLVDELSAPGFMPEFGLALLLETDGRKILFDTGAGEALLPNLRTAGIAPETISEVILSHGHYDHTGGLAALAPQCVWCAPGVELPHFSRHADGSVHDISMPEKSLSVLKKSKITYVENFTEIMPGLWLTGPIPRLSDEDCGGDFYREKECISVDIIPEEQALLTADGTLISGCCHAGIINTLEFCRKVRPEITIHTVIGGLHLRRASEKRLQETAVFLRNYGIKHLSLFHCTGANAVTALQKALPDCRIDTPLPGEKQQSEI